MADEKARSCLEGSPPAWLAYFCRSLLIEEPDYRLEPSNRPARRHLYEKRALNFDNNNSSAFRLLVSTCADEGNCLFYDGPRDSTCSYTFEPGIIERYQQFKEGAGLDSVAYLDLSSLLQREHFNDPEFAGCDGIHPNKAGQRLLADHLAEEVVLRVRNAL